MPYSTQATSSTPAHIIYLIDASGSMVQNLEGIPKIDHVNAAIQRILRTMIRRSMKGGIVAARYKVLMIAYSDEPVLMTDWFESIDHIAKTGEVPEVTATDSTNTEKAFSLAYDILTKLLDNETVQERCPAPLVCHLTDGIYTTGDPEPIVKKIMDLKNNDGNVLVENIYVDENLTHTPISEIKSWQGISDILQLNNEYAKKLFSMSSTLPESYAREMWKLQYSLKQDCTMIFPCANKNLLELAFTASSASK